MPYAIHTEIQERLAFGTLDTESVEFRYVVLNGERVYLPKVGERDSNGRPVELLSRLELQVKFIDRNGRREHDLVVKAKNETDIGCHYYGVGVFRVEGDRLVNV